MKIQSQKPGFFPLFVLSGLYSPVGLPFVGLPFDRVARTAIMTTTAMIPIIPKGTASTSFQQPSGLRCSLQHLCFTRRADSFDSR